MTNPLVGVLALQYCQIELPVKVMRSQAGYYIGTQNEDGAPCSRESVEYWTTHAEATQCLVKVTWRQKLFP